MTPKPNTHTDSGLPTAVIIGGGLSGLAVSALLAKQGWHVTVLEKNSTLGGRAQVLNEKGFHFDMGPSWYMMPEVFDRYFQIFNKKTSDYYKLERLNPRYSVFFEGGQKLTLEDDFKQNQKIFEKIEKGAGEKLKKYLKTCEIVYNHATKKLLYEDINNPKNWFNFENIISVLNVFGRLNYFSSWQTEVKKLFKDDRLQKILCFPALFLGGSPYQTPSVYSILSWADFGKGIFYPTGGMGKLVQALESLAKELGVTILTNSEVLSLDIENGQIRGVFTRSSYHPADVVVNTSDLLNFETNYLPPKYQTIKKSEIPNKKLGISALMIYLGLNKKIKNIPHHSIYFSKNWQENFSDIFEKKVIPRNPSFYISVRTKTDSTIAPPDSEEIVILVPLSPKTNYSPGSLNQLADKIILQTEKILDENIKNHISVQKLFTPKNYASQYNAYQGTALGLAHSFDQSFFGRPNNKNKKIRGLFYAGQYTNPGVGVPMSLVSAEIVGKMVGKAPSKKSEIFKKGSVTYYNSSLFFTGQVKKDVFTLYSFVRVADDFVDQVPAQISQFEQMWEETKKSWQGKFVSHQVVQDFVEMCKRVDIKWEWIESFWNSMRMDTVKKVYKSQKELDEYIYGSADVIGFMMVKILNLPSQTMRYAGLQGKAMQLLNFIRDILEDESLGRQYLNYNKNKIHNKEYWQKTINHYLDLYFKIQKEAEAGYKYIPKKYLVPIKTAANMYKKTAKIIQQNPQIVWSKKIKPKKAEVIFEVFKNLLFS